ncbi:helix-turn-helix domain-containing protein [Leifsonia sp. NPDC056665]|uniref:helix-turn-helix domain-containing protein n=1 Tax=Leifsonia sp. NPDC056665 TaxID=3345901 RepID=UPI00369ADAB0
MKPGEQPPDRRFARLLLNYDDTRRRFSETTVPLLCTTTESQTFRTAVSGAIVGGIVLNAISGSRHTVEQPHQQGGSETGANTMIHIQLTGESTLEQDGRAAVVRAGDITAYTAARPFLLDHGGESLIVRIPHRALPVPASTVDEVVAVRFERERPLVGIVHPLAAQLGRTAHRLEGGAGRRLVESAVGMLGAVVVEALQDRETGTMGSQLDEVIEYIEVNLSRPDLTVAEIASANFMSVRKLHALFGEHDSTVAAWVRSRRLDRCRSDLADSEFGALRIGEVAARWGFKDAAHFSRLFTGRYATSPREFRASVAGVAARGRVAGPRATPPLVAVPL